jgi:hypothetical protein
VGNFENVSKWLENMKTVLPGYQKIIVEPLERLKNKYSEGSEGEHEEEKEEDKEEEDEEE